MDIWKAYRFMSNHRSEFFDVVVAAVLYERLWHTKTRRR